MLISTVPVFVSAQGFELKKSAQFDFCGQEVSIAYGSVPQLNPSAELTATLVADYADALENSPLSQTLKALLEYKSMHKPDDWLYYQLIRKAAQQISPKAENYFRYTMLKWYLLTRSGYDAILTVSGQRILFYVHSEDNAYNVPIRIHNGRQYVCLNFHDYKNIDFAKDLFTPVQLYRTQASQSFSYKITTIPKFKAADYVEKRLRFKYNDQEYDFRIKLNQQIKSIFANYPVVDYDLYLNIPLSPETYGSLIPLLRKNLKGMNVKNGVDYLMRFTRYAFMFQADTDVFGSEKRLSPEQTLLSDQSDCEDRVALFYCLVKEIYDLPMIVLSYPNHVAIAVKFDKPVGKPVIYNGQKYSVCEPTPQKHDLAIGQTLPELSNLAYEVTYVYEPGTN